MARGVSGRLAALAKAGLPPEKGEDGFPSSPLVCFAAFRDRGCPGRPLSGSGPIADIYRRRGALRPKGRLAAAFSGHGPWGQRPQGPVTGFVRAKHPTGVYLRGTRLQGVRLDPFGTVTYASPNGATPLQGWAQKCALRKDAKSISLPAGSDQGAALDLQP